MKFFEDDNDMEDNHKTPDEPTVENRYPDDEELKRGTRTSAGRLR